MESFVISISSTGATAAAPRTCCWPTTRCSSVSACGNSPPCASSTTCSNDRRVSFRIDVLEFSKDQGQHAESKPAQHFRKQGRSERPSHRVHVADGEVPNHPIQAGVACV